MKPGTKCMGIIILLLSALAGFSQTRTYTGVVKSNADNAPLEFVTVSVKGTNHSVVTNNKGEFSITATAGDIIILSYTGFLNQEFVLGENTNIEITLTPGEGKLDEVVVVGYGTQRKSTVTASISKLDSRVLESGLRSNPAQALAGTIPGLRVSAGTGRPGSLPAIVLRGGTNFDGSGSPLIIMDGQVRGSLSDINPEDIASMEVLKDASATAIYGARASNGVILITSKKGSPGKSHISLKARTGINYLNVPYNFLTAEEYIKWSRMGVVQAIINGTFGTVASNSALSVVGPRATGNMYKDASGNILDGNYSTAAIWSLMRLTDENRELLSKPGWKTMKDAVPTNAAGNYDPNGTYADLIYQDFNYGDYGLHNHSLTQDYNIGMSGGNENGNYYANLGLYDEDGLSLKTFYRRLNFTINGDYKIKSWLKSESGLQFARANWRDQSLQNGEANYWGRMLSAPPTLRGINANGEFILGRDANDGNPIVNIDKYIRKNQSDKFTLNQAFTVNLTKDLYFRLGGILMYDETFFESFNKDFRTGLLSITNPNAGWNRDRASSAGFDRTIRQTYNAIANYHLNIVSSHQIDMMAGFEFYEAYNLGVAASGRLAPTDDFSDLGLTLNNSETQTRGTDTYHSKERIISGFGRINYSYNDKYLASFTVRRDGYSRLLGDNQFGNFPAFSLGWLAHREDFLSGTSNWLSFLKLRGSWGKNGNIGGIGIYELQGAYGAQSAYNGTIGFLMSSIANPGLKWEKTNTIEVGMDMGFFNNRLNFSVAAYNRITDDKIANVILPASSGISSIRTNNGSMRNRGVELELGYTVINSDDFTWRLNANASWNKNTVLKLPYNGNENNRQGGQQIYDPKTGQVIWVGGLQEGQEWGEIFGFIPAGIIRTQKDLENYNKLDLAAMSAYNNGGAGRGVASQKLIDAGNLNGGGFRFIPTQLGDMMWQDLDKNDTIDYRDMRSIGRQLPRWIGGFSTTVSWKGFSLYARLDFALGHVQQDLMHVWSLASAQGEFNATDLVKETWTPDNPNAKYPRYTWADQLNTKNFDRPSSMMIVNSGYLAFREVTLSYSVPASILEKLRISSLVLSATGQNLGYLTHELLNLPERTGVQNSAYTIPTQLIFGINLTF